MSSYHFALLNVKFLHPLPKDQLHFEKFIRIFGHCCMLDRLGSYHTVFRSIMDDNLNLNDTVTFSRSGVNIFASIYSSIGLLANLLLLYIIIADKFFRKKIYILLLICSLMNLMLTIVPLFFSGVFSFNNLSLSTIVAWCRILLCSVYTCYGITIMNLSLIAIYRYFSVVRPFSNIYLKYKKRFLITSEIIIWIISIAVSTCASLYIRLDAESIALCDYTNITLSVTIYLICFVVIYYLLPSSIIIILYWRIIINQRNRVRPGQPSRDQVDIQKKYKLIKSLVSISACYILLTWPMFMVLFAMAITQKSLTQIQQENSAYFWLSLFSMSTCENVAVINPFLYFIFDQNIRHRVKCRLKQLVKR